MIRDMLGGGIGVTPGLALSVATGLWLMFTRLTLGTSGSLADTDHLIGALALAVAVTAMAESARPVRFLNICLGAALVMDGSWLQRGADILAGLGPNAASVPRGPIRHFYGSWSRLLVWRRGMLSWSKLRLSPIPRRSQPGVS